MSTALQAHKRCKIDKILENDTYMPDSGVCQQLRKSLGKLSNNDLGLLLLIIGLKVQAKGTRIPAAIDCLHAAAKKLYAKSNESEAVRTLLKAQGILANQVITYQEIEDGRDT